MPTNVIMPSLGFDMTQGKLSRWLKNEGDEVKKGEAIAEVETEKANVEIEAFVSGTLSKIVIQSGQMVPVNTVIGVIGEAGEPAPSAPAPAPQPAASSTEPVRAAPSASREAAPQPGGNGRVKASPIARRMAEANGIDLRALNGSGPGGRIMEKDVEAAVAAQPKTQVQERAAAPSPSAPRPAPAPVAAAPAQTGIEMPLSRMRQAIAQRMAQSKTTAPHFYVTVEVNMAEALKMREQLNALAPENDKISVNDLIIAAAARTLLKHPTFNASFRGDRLELHQDVNIGVAVAVEGGLLTPTVPNADRKSLKEIAAASRGAAERARANKMRPEDLNPGTFTISNLGMFGVDEFSAIINPPEAAILALGAAVKRPIVVDDEVKIAPVMKATISVDHRVADGAMAARFMQDLKQLLENPVNLLIG